MPRRRKITIRASELECFETLVRELQQRPEFAGFDPSSLHVWAYERYEPKLKDADAILRRFDYWLGVHKGERYLMANGSRLFNKKELAEALGVARPTLDRWIANGWLEPCRVQISAGDDTLFAANAVREVLEQFR
uniref:helix-turn-helix transcriptional regulator n=1 Tax=Alistipes putredinis TaxID=28117 RepID=UPI003FD7B325